MEDILEHDCASHQSSFCHLCHSSVIIIQHLKKKVMKQTLNKSFSEHDIKGLHLIAQL